MYQKRGLNLVLSLPLLMEQDDGIKKIVREKNS